MTRMNDPTYELFHTERCYYPNPLETLFLIFGRDNCIFTHIEGVYMLRLLPSSLTYSIADNPPREAWPRRLAQCALRNMPIMRVAQLMCEKLINGSNPILEPFAANIRKVPVPTHHKRKRTCNDVRPNDKQRLVDELTERLGCAEIGIDNKIVQKGQNQYFLCRITAGDRTFEPHVYCETAETAEHHALVGALCQIE